MEENEKSLSQLARAAESKGEKWFDDEPEQPKQKTEAETKSPAASAQPKPITPPDDQRYEFPIPRMAIFDLLGIQLAECTRMARTLSDDVVVKPYTSKELPPIIEAFRDVVKSSAVIADTMDLVQNGRPRLPGPQRSGRS